MSNKKGVAQSSLPGYRPITTRRIGHAPPSSVVPVDMLVQSSRREDGAEDAEDAIAALAYRESGFGINAGQVAGAVVASLPCTNCEEALREGLTKMVIVPREKWEGLVS